MQCACASGSEITGDSLVLPGATIRVRSVILEMSTLGFWIGWIDAVAGTFPIVLAAYQELACFWMCFDKLEHAGQISGSSARLPAPSRACA